MTGEPIPSLDENQPTICLNMIVRNEEHVIERCLASVRPLIDHWLVVDTGSTDQTRRTIREYLSDVPGELVEREWQDFATNRTEAITLAAGRADYLLVIDADEVLEAAVDFRMPFLEADCYSVCHVIEGSSVSFFLPQIFRNALPWRFEGVLHEALVCDVPHTRERLPGLSTRGYFDSARNADSKAKYLADCQLLETVVDAEPDNARAVFYLAQSYRDAGLSVKALQAYRRRAEMGGWEEEVWYALYQIGWLLERLGAERGDVADAYLQAWEWRPRRAESLCELARYHRINGDHHRAWLVAECAAGMPKPEEEHLFLDESVYRWRVLEELSLARYHTGRLDESREAWQQLLLSAELPPEDRARIESNRRWFQPSRPDIS